jgi:error-prone DNA polymerase
MCYLCISPVPAARGPRPAPFTELRAHTAYSFGDGAVSPESLARRARALGYSHLGITDCADLGALAKFAVEAMAPSKDPACAHAKEHGTSDCPVCQRPIRPIVGAELMVDGKPAAFLAKNPIGYNSLAALVTLSRVGEWRAWEKTAQGKRRGRPHVTFEQVAAYSDGLHALTGPASGALADRVSAGDEFGARRTLARWKEVFYGHISVEVQLHHTGGDESELAAKLIDLAERQGVPWVVTQDPRYVDDRGRLVHDLLTALRYDLTVDQANSRGLLRPNGDWRLTPPHELVRRWQGRTQGLTESLRIAESCEPFTLDWMRPPMPDFTRVRATGSGQRAANDIDYLRELAYVGARERWGESLTYEQTTQIEHELRIIGNLGFAGFFLVMADAIRFARSRGILCQGRGSAANSAVAFCLQITAADPVKHGLLFERFLSEARLGGKAVEPPDIDVDFEHERREEVLDYMYNKYERAHAAITGVTQMYRAPNAVLDAMRALGYPVETAQALSKRLHHADPLDGAEAIREELAAKVGLKIDDTRGQTLLRALAGFDGLARMRSTHVGGFVLSARPLGDFLPVEQTTMGRTIIQFDKDDLDYINVPKFDFLGLGGLTMLRKGFDAIEARTGVRPELYKLPYDDKKTYDMIARGDTIGTFQIESRAQIQSILHTKPELLYDIVVQVALIRPGPIQAKFVHPYTERRLGRQAVTYPHPLLEPILKRTQGIPIFQEQAMAISMALGGYDGARADALRRTMGNERKKGKLLLALKDLKAAILERIAKGEIESIPESAVDQICDDLVSFANYGFPESHAWSFALIAFATAWLKAHYPTEFLLGLLNAQPMGFYPISTLIHDSRRNGVEVVPPCLSVGSWDCTIESGQRATGNGQRDLHSGSSPLPDARCPMPVLRVGWRFVRGMGETTLERLKNAWMERQFTSIADVVRRAKLDRGESLNLARAGAFSAWTEDRRHAAWEALRAAGDALPLAPASSGFHEPAPLDRDRLVLLDYYAVGLSLNGHPMEAGRDRLRAAGAVSSAELESLPNGRTITVGGLVTIRQRPSTAGGTIFLLLEDELGFINVVVPASLVPANEEVVKQALFVIVRGKLENDGATINVVGRQFKEFEMEAIEHRARSFH